MLTFYPPLYPDELLGSGHARFTEYLGLEKIKLFDSADRQMVDFTQFEIDKNILRFINLLPSQDIYSADYLIDHHTMYPLFRLLATTDNLARFKQEMISPQIDGTVRRQLRLAQKNFLAYLSFCPKCAQEDITKFGEPYWHRIHQIKGIDICDRHLAWLDKISFSHRNFPSARRAGVQHFSPIYIEKNYAEYTQMQCKFVNLARCLFEDNSTQIDLKIVRAKFHTLFALRNLVWGNKIQPSKLIAGYKDRYSSDTLTRLNDHIDKRLERFTKNYFRSTHIPIIPLIIPLLAMDFLNIDHEGFIKVPTDDTTFGTGPWACLNNNCKSFNMRIVDKCSISIHKSYKRGDIKCDKCNHITRLSCDSTSDWRETKVRIIYNKPISESELIHYRNQLLDLIKENPTASRSELKGLNPILYQTLQQQDQDWFKKNIPAPRQAELTKKFLCYWKSKDELLISKIKNAHIKLLNAPGKPKRITRKAIGTFIGVDLRYTQNMPQCNKLLAEISESHECCLKRRIEYYVNYFTKEQIVPAQHVYNSLLQKNSRELNLQIFIDDSYQRIINGVNS
jgi:hypothetical protein